MLKQKFISKKEKKPINSVGEANLINGDFWIVEHEEEIKQDNESLIIQILTEIKDILKNQKI